MVQTILQQNNRQYMTQEQFCYWLQGLFELCPDLKCLTEAQVKQIRDHLGYVFEGKAVPSPLPASSSTTIYTGYGSGVTSVTYPQNIIDTQQPFGELTTVC